jgi:signal transduction histidine kinase
VSECGFSGGEKDLLKLGLEAYFCNKLMCYTETETWERILMNIQKNYSEFLRKLNAHPHLVSSLMLMLVLTLWGITTLSISSQIGKPFPGFFFNPARVVSSFTPKEFTGWQAGLRPWDRIIAVNGHNVRELRKLVQGASIGQEFQYTLERGNHQLTISVPTMEFTPDIVVKILPAYFVSSLVFIFVGIFVYLRNSTFKINRYLLVYLLLWSLGPSIIWESFLSLSKWMGYLLIPYAISAPVAGWVLFLNFPLNETRQRFLQKWGLGRWYLIFGFVSIGLMSGFQFLTNIADVDDMWRILAFLMGWPYFLAFGLSSIPLKLMPLFLIIGQKGERILKQQALVVIIGLLLGLSSWYLFIWAPAAIHVAPALSTQWSGLIPAIYPLSIGYAILRYHLLDIRVVVRKGLIYSLLTASLTVAFVLLALLSASFYRELTGGESILSMVIPALLVAFIFQPARHQIQLFVDRAFFRKEYEIRQTLTRFSQNLITLRTRSEVVRLVRETIMDTLKAGDVKIWMLVENHFQPVALNGLFHQKISRDSALVEFLRKISHVFYPLSDNISDQANELHAIGAHLAVSLKSADKFSGFLSLTERSSGVLYSQDDLELLTMIANSTALALENARLYEEKTEMMRLQAVQATSIQEEERRRIASELHDGVGPSLASLNIRLQTARKQLERENNPISMELAEIAEQAQENIHDLRRLIYDLRPAALDELGLVPALQEYINRYQKDQKISIKYEFINPISGLSTDLETTLFRIIQEALANVARHSHASQVEIIFDKKESEISVKLCDNGIGFDPALQQKGNHLGLWSMQKRVEQFGGRLQLISSPGFGTEIIIQFPIDNVPSERISANG